MIIIALGANLPGPYGSPKETLDEALRALGRAGIAVVASSRQWLTEPVPVSSDPWYRNAVAVVETALSPRALVKQLKAIEQDFGRAVARRNAPRILDLDLIAYNEVVISEKDLLVPHPRMHERAFVLLPLQEVAPGWKHPLLKKTVQYLIDRLPPGQKANPMEEAA